MPIDILEVQISLDGNSYCALVGENLQEGIAGFGDTPLQALSNLCLALKSEPLNLTHYTIGGE